MAANAAAILEEVFAFGKRRRKLQHAVRRVALLATGLHILSAPERVQPELVKTVRLDSRSGGAAVAAVATGTAEPLGVMNLQQLFARVTDGGMGQGVRFFTRRGGHRRRRQCDGLAHA